MIMGLMLWIKAFHIIAMVAWFAGLFYLPRLFVYHASTHDVVSLERFCLMERRLYYGIMCPAAILTTLLGMALIGFNYHYYMKAFWMHAKLGVVGLIWVYHGFCAHFLHQFARNANNKTSLFFRVFNEIPTLLLILVVVLVIVRPSL